MQGLLLLSKFEGAQAIPKQVWKNLVALCISLTNRLLLASTAAVCPFFSSDAWPAAVVSKVCQHSGQCHVANSMVSSICHVSPSSNVKEADHSWPSFGISSS
ncbi:hypothetical protein MTO96_002690 [Rhipicephalus appendiculatus]